MRLEKEAAEAEASAAALADAPDVPTTEPGTLNAPLAQSTTNTTTTEPEDVIAREVTNIDARIPAKEPALAK